MTPFGLLCIHNMEAIDACQLEKTAVKKEAATLIWALS